MHPDEPTPTGSPSRVDARRPGTKTLAETGDDLAAKLGHPTATPAAPLGAVTGEATPPAPPDSTGITAGRWGSRDHAITAEPVAGVDLDLARAIVAHSTRDGEWTTTTAEAIEATMARAVRARQVLGNAGRINALARRLKRPVAPAEMPRNTFHERAVTAQMWDDAVTHAPSQDRRLTS